jgi:rubrerythrin
MKAMTELRTVTLREWECPKCGHIHRSEQAPDQCSRCRCKVSARKPGRPKLQAAS